MEKSPQAVIAEAAAMDRYMKDEIIIAVFARLERLYWTEFKDSKTSEERVRTWAKANVLDDIKKQMHVTVDAGERAVLATVKK